MTETISGGHFTIARKVFFSRIWMKPPLYMKAWVWIIGRASYADHEKNGYLYHRGEFVTTYDEILKANAHYHNRKHIFPTIKQIRIILEWLENEGMIRVEPIKSGPGLTGANTRERTGAYVGTKIIVVNYDTYQTAENYKGRHKGGPSIQQGHYNNKGTNKVKKETPDFFSLLERYSDRDLINSAFKAVASTRKSGKVADSVLLAQVQKWDRYPVGQVEAGIRIYLEKDYASQGKREEYLLGIIRNQNGTQANTTPETGIAAQPPLEELRNDD